MNISNTCCKSQLPYLVIHGVHKLQTQVLQFGQALQKARPPRHGWRAVEGGTSQGGREAGLAETHRPLPQRQPPQPWQLSKGGLRACVRAGTHVCVLVFKLHVRVIPGYDDLVMS